MRRKISEAEEIRHASDYDEDIFLPEFNCKNKQRQGVNTLPYMHIDQSANLYNAN